MDKPAQTKDYTFKKVMQRYSYYVAREYTDELLPEIRQIQALMVEHKIDQAEPWTVKIFTDYLECRQFGLEFAGQRAKVVEALMKYGNGSLFWDTLQQTHRQRIRDWARVTYVCRLYLKGEAGKKGKFCRVLCLQSIDWRKKLLVNPLSPKQLKILMEAERELGIYYSDLSPEENGEVWMQNMEREEKNGYQEG